MQQHNYRSLYNIHLYTPVFSTHIHSPFCLFPSNRFVSLSVPHKEHTDWGCVTDMPAKKFGQFFFIFFVLSPSPAQKPPDPAQLISLPEDKREMVSDGIRTRQKNKKTQLKMTMEMI